MIFSLLYHMSGPKFDPEKLKQSHRRLVKLAEEYEYGNSPAARIDAERDGRYKGAPSDFYANIVARRDRRDREPVLPNQVQLLPPIGKHEKAYGVEARYFNTPGTGLSPTEATALVSAVPPAVLGSQLTTAAIERKVKDVPVLGTAVRLAKDYTDWVTNPLTGSVVTAPAYLTYLLANEAVGKVFGRRGPSLDLTVMSPRIRSAEDLGEAGELDKHEALVKKFKTS